MKEDGKESSNQNTPWYITPEKMQEIEKANRARLQNAIEKANEQIIGGVEADDNIDEQNLKAIIEKANKQYLYGNGDEFNR